MTKAEELEMILTRAEDSTISPMVGHSMVAGWTRHNYIALLRSLRLADAVEKLNDDLPNHTYSLQAEIRNLRKIAHGEA
jgi:hypothetical protein